MALMGCTKAADDIIIPPASLTLDAFYTGYISNTEQDNGVVWTWSLLPDNMQMDITITCNGIPYCHETTRATTLIQKDLDTNVRYDYLFRLFDGTPDKNAYPHNSQYQSNVLKMARNAIEYLKTR